MVRAMEVLTRVLDRLRYGRTHDIAVIYADPDDDTKDFGPGPLPFWYFKCTCGRWQHGYATKDEAVVAATAHFRRGTLVVSDNE
jgi:hypothetical protein